MNVTTLLYRKSSSVEEGPDTALPKRDGSQSPLAQKCADQSENAEADEEDPDDEHPRGGSLGRHRVIS